MLFSEAGLASKEILIISKLDVVVATKTVMGL